MDDKDVKKNRTRTGSASESSYLVPYLIDVPFLNTKPTELDLNYQVNPRVPRFQSHQNTCPVYHFEVIYVFGCHASVL